MERLAVELIIRCTHVCEIPFTCQRVSWPRQLALTFHGPLLLLPLDCLLGATSSGVNVHKHRFHTHAPHKSTGSKWDDKISSHLGHTIKICNSAEPQTSTRLRLCFGNRISPWRGMNVQMCYRWDSLNWDLAHWYSLCTITVLQNWGAAKC